MEELLRRPLLRTSSMLWRSHKGHRPCPSCGNPPLISRNPRHRYLGEGCSCRHGFWMVLGWQDNNRTTDPNLAS